MDLEVEDGGGVGVHAAESEADIDVVANAEYSRMKRQYFLMQRRRHSIIEKAGGAGGGGGSAGGTKGPSKGLKLVHILEIQRDNLESELAAATSSSNLKKDEQIKARIWTLLNIYEKYTAQINSLQTEIKAMEKTVRIMTTKFYKAKLKIQAVLGCAVSIDRLEKTIENKESKLHSVKSQYDTFMTQNRELKDEIAVKIDRRFAIFSRMKRLHNKMTECRKNLNSSVDEALSVYGVWDEAARKITFIKDKYKDQVRQHLLEMKEYDRLLFHDLREIRFYSTKNKPRGFLEKTLNRDARKTAREIVTLQKECRRYRNQFLRLEEFDPKQNVDTIITNYRALEQKSFSHFQQISDFNKEGLRLMEEIHDLKLELDVLASEKEKRVKANDEELLRLEVGRDNERDKLAHLKAQIEVTDESTKKVAEALEAFFRTAECDLQPLRELLGKNEHVTIQNLREAFQLMENHIATLQLEKELLTIQKDVETHTTVVVPKPAKAPRPSGGPYEPQIVIAGRPELGMEKKDDEEDTLFSTAPIPKAVQREHLLAKFRELGVIGPPPIKRFESITAHPVRSGVDRSAKSSVVAEKVGEEEEEEEESDDDEGQEQEDDEEDDEDEDEETEAAETGTQSPVETTDNGGQSSKDTGQGQESQTQQAVQAPGGGTIPPPGDTETSGNETSDNFETEEEEEEEEG